MKTLNYIVCALSMALLGLGSTACSDDSYDDPSGETFIYSIAVSNGGFTGAENIAGEIDEQNSTIAFSIPAETDIEAVRFSTKLSLGAKLEKDSYDVSSGATDIVVVNNHNTSTYHATFTMQEPKENPVLTAIISLDDNGVECQGFISDVTETVYLNCEGSTTAKPIEVDMLPRRSTYTFTTAVNGVISVDNPGQLLMDFMGLTKTYDISFAGVPTFGGDFNDVTVYDYSLHEGGLQWDDYKAENTRWTKFDGEHLLIVSREGGTNPKVLLWDDIKSGSPVEHLLDKTGISGGTFEVSAGGIANGHYYICNLTTDLSEASSLKIYHWADMDATCETLVDYTGGNGELSGRWGDNMSVCLDENGNGYLWMFDHAQGSRAIRFSVSNYTDIAAPEEIATPYNVAYYGAINPVDGESNVYTLTSTYQRAILLVDSNLNVLNIIDAKDGCDYPCVAETDARIISYNGERYLITCNSYGWHYKNAQTLRVYDLSQGLNASLAFTNFNQTDHSVLWSYSLNGSNCSAFSANTGAAVGSDGHLRIMGAAPRSGFVMAEITKRR